MFPADCLTRVSKNTPKGVKHSVSINHVTRMTQNGGTLDQPFSRTVGSEERSDQPESNLQETSQNYYAVEQIIRHVTTTTEQRHLVSWYGYSSTDDTVQAPEHLAMPFVVAYGRRRKQQFTPTIRRRSDGTGCKCAGARKSNNRGHSS